MGIIIDKNKSHNIDFSLLWPFAETFNLISLKLTC